MLRSVKSLIGYELWEIDGQMGHVVDFLFDDFTWTLRHLVVDTGRWLPGRRVLISPQVLGHPDSASRRWPVILTRQQVQTSPDIDTDKPVSRQKLLELHKHYDWDNAWLMVSEAPTVPIGSLTDEDKAPDAPTDPHLRSFKEVCGYHIHAADGRIGHVDDLLIHEDDWTLRYIVACTRNWIPGPKVLLTPGQVDRIVWEERTIHVPQTREQVKTNPVYDPLNPINAGVEGQDVDYTGRITINRNAVPQPGK